MCTIGVAIGIIIVIVVIPLLCDFVVWYCCFRKMHAHLQVPQYPSEDVAAKINVAKQRIQEKRDAWPSSPPTLQNAKNCAPSTVMIGCYEKVTDDVSNVQSIKCRLYRRPDAFREVVNIGSQVGVYTYLVAKDDCSNGNRLSSALKKEKSIFLDHLGVIRLP
uniref:Uncharacterized protein n=1 Tax=Panagrellus redivivus TaxID=6233 RepID=A0A7E4VEI5_PANRE